MAPSRKIIHLDLDAFFCSVEEQRDPDLKTKPFAVGGTPEGRGVVTSCSYAARKFGLHSAMPMARAVRKCPHLTIVPGRHRAYREASEKVMERLYSLTPFVEQVSIDEAFLDVTDHPDPAEQLAVYLQTTIRDELGLPCSLGVGSNKMVAKIATDAGKSAVQSDGPPYAIKVVPPGHEISFLEPLPVKAIWGVGRKMEASLKKLGIQTIGDLANWPEKDLAQRFGLNGSRLARYARGIDDSPIETVREAKSISKETTFAQDIRDGDSLQGVLLSLAEGVGHRLRRVELSCSTINLKLRRPDFTTLSRQVTLKEATDLDQKIYSEAKNLLESVWTPGQPVRLLGVGVSRFSSAGQQLNLWDEKGSRMQEAIDSVRKKFGHHAVRWGTREDPG